MTSHSLLLRLIPWLFLVVLAGVASLLGNNPVWALQWVSWLAGSLCFWVFMGLLALLSPGSRADSRLIFTVWCLMLAPIFFMASITIASDALGLLLALTSFFFGIRTLENSRLANVIGAVGFAALAANTAYILAALLVPLLAAIAVHLFVRKKWIATFSILALGFAAVLYSFWYHSEGASVLPCAWSVSHFFKNHFTGSDGAALHYWFPNVIYLLFPLCHPAFCLPLAGLLLLFKRTDLLLPAKKVLVLCICVYLTVLGGLPQQHLHHLIPAYALLLLLLFPAWDRMYCYGFIFFPKLTKGILVTVLALQIIMSGIYLAPILESAAETPGAGKHWESR